MEKPLDARVRAFNDWIKQRQGDALGPLEGWTAGWLAALEYAALALENGESEDYDTGAEDDAYHYTYFRGPSNEYASDAADLVRGLQRASRDNT